MRIDGTIYLDHQATTPLDTRVFEEMLPHFKSRFGNPHSSEHAVGWRASQAVERAASEVAALVGGDNDEIIFTSGATEANNLALFGISHEKAAQGRKRILLSSIEHKCILEIGRKLSSELGFVVEIIPVNKEGRLDLVALQNALSDDVLLISVMATNNEIGTIQDISRISKLAKEAGAFFHCDAAQAPCAMDVSQLSIHADMVSLSSHKMYGPSGIGALFVRRDIQSVMRPIILGGGQQNGLRSGTLPTALCVGFGAAARFAMSGEGSSTRSLVAKLRDQLAEELSAMPCDTWFNGPIETNQKHPGNLNVGFEGVSASDLISRLQPRLAVSTGSACTSGILEASHVLQAIGLDDERAASCVRFSIGKHTTPKDILDAAGTVKRAIIDIIESGLLKTS